MAELPCFFKLKNPVLGGAVFIAGLQIYNERVSDVGTTDVTIIWDTNLESTSRVIYSSSDESYVFDWTNPPNYGYSHSTPEYNTPANLYGVTGSHTVHITGLSMGTTYYYRCVSHTSPDETITVEHSFTTKGVAGEETYEGEEEEEEGEKEGEPSFAEATEGKEVIPGEGVEPVIEGTTTEEEGELVIMPAPEVITGFLPNLLANIGDIFKGFGTTCYPNFPWWIILIFGAYPLLTSILNQYREKKIKTKWLWVFSIIIVLILFLIWLILKCLYIWIIAIAVLVYLFVVDFLKRKQL